MATNKKFGNMCAFIGLILVVALLIIRTVFGWLNIDALNAVIGLLGTIQEIVLILAIVISAYDFANAKGKSYQMVFWVAVILYIAFKYVFPAIF